MARNICKLDRSTPDTLTAIQNISGSIIYGDVTNAAISQLPETWVSIYTTRKTTVPDNHTRSGFSGDVSFLYGRGVAKNQEDAEQLAEANCNQIVDQWTSVNNRRALKIYTLKCQKLATQVCQ